MASNRDPRKSYRTRRQNRTSSSDRAKRSAKSTAPKPTSSSTRSKTKGAASSRVTSSKDRVKKNPIKGPARGAQGPRTPPVQGPSRKVSGLIGSRSNTRKGGAPTPGAKFNPSKQLSRGAKVATILNPRSDLPARLVAAGGLAAELLASSRSKSKPKKKPTNSVGKYNTKDADGTVRSRKKVGPKKVGPKKVGPKKVGTVAQRFDAAFAKARKAGQKTFTFQGKVYNTKTK